MSIYDTLLGTVGQGYAQANQNAMAQAQMPTFADRFLAGLRQNTEDEYKRKMGESTLAMNQAYKLSQEQHMREQERLGMLQRQAAALTPTRNVTPLTYDSAVAQVTGLGGDASWVPKQEFETKYENVAMPIDQQQQELAAGAGLGIMQDQTFNPMESAEYQTPIEGTGWGQEAWQKELDRRNKLSLQELKGEQAAQIKREKESQIAILNREFAQGKISAAQHANGIIKAVAIADSRAAGLASQGIIVNPLLNVPGTQGGLGAGSVPPTLPSMGQGGSPAPATGGVAKTAPRPPGGLPVADPATKEGRAIAEKNAKEQSAADNTLLQMSEMRNAVNSIKNDPAFSSALSTTGIIKTVIPKTAEYGLAQRVETIKSKLMLSALSALKDLSATGASGLGQLSNQEGEVLRNSIASLNLNMKDTDFKNSLDTILGHIDRIEGIVKNRATDVMGARSPGAGYDMNRSAPTTVQEVKEYIMKDGSVQKWGKDANGNWVQR